MPAAPQEKSRAVARKSLVNVEQDVELKLALTAGPMQATQVLESLKKCQVFASWGLTQIEELVWFSQVVTVGGASPRTSFPTRLRSKRARSCRELYWV